MVRNTLGEKIGIHMWFTENVNPTFSTASVVNAANSAANVQKDVKTHVDR